MRNLYHSALKQCFYHHLIMTRVTLEMTQSDMAEYLAMNYRSYVDLDHGKSCCSATTLVLYLLYLCEDVDAFLEDLRNAFEAEPVVKRKAVRLHKAQSNQHPSSATRICK